MKKNSKSFLLSLLYIILALAVCVAVFALTYNGGGAYMLRQGEANASPVSPVGENIPDTPTATPKVLPLKSRQPPGAFFLLRKTVCGDIKTVKAK